MYAPKINLYVVGGLMEHEIKILSNMIRGLRNCYGGFKAVSGLRDDVFIHASRNRKKVVLYFQSVRKALSFKAAIDRYFAGKLEARRVRV